MRAFRFGFQVRQQTADELRSTDRAAEAAGFDVISTWDHVVDGWAPLAPLLAMAEPFLSLGTPDEIANHLRA